LTGRSGRRSGERARKRGRYPKWVTYLWLALAISALLSLGVGAILYSSASDVDIGLGPIGLIIEGREARFEIGLELSRGVSLRSGDLEMVSGNRTYDLDLDNDIVRTRMGAYELAEVLDIGSAQVRGDARAKVDPIPWEISGKVDRKVDLSEIRDLNSSVQVRNVTLQFNSLFDSKVEMEFTAGFEKDIWIKARNTTATIETGLGSYEGDIREMEMGLDGEGTASLVIPNLALLYLTLGNNDVRVDFWGITLDFEYPVT